MMAQEGIRGSQVPEDGPWDETGPSDHLSAGEGVPLCVVKAPGRMSPLGVHTDHQGGWTSGFTIDRGVTLRVLPAQVPGTVAFRSELLGATGPVPADSGFASVGDWADLLRGVLRMWRSAGNEVPAMSGVITSDLLPGGVSTSAAVQVALLLALQEMAGQRRISPMENAGFIQRSEQQSTGLNVGLLDPAVILSGAERSLVVLDCKKKRARLLRLPKRCALPNWYLMHPSVARELRYSPYNERVSECAEAARNISGDESVTRLSDVTQEQFRRARTSLPDHLRKRCEHYFSESRRLKHGMRAWGMGDMESFGHLMTASGESLLRDFQCGTPPVQDLVNEVRAIDGVFGVSPAGGGFGGYVQILGVSDLESQLRDIVRRHGERWQVDLPADPVIKVSMGRAASVVQVP